jgi:fructokinase
VQESYLDGVFALHFCSVSIGDFPMREAHKRAIDIQQKRGGIVSFDPNLRFSLWDSREALQMAVREFLPLSDIVKLSEDELEFVTGVKEPEAAAHKLFAQGVKLVLYTCGSKGAYAYTPEVCTFSPAHPVRAVDTTGAGDGFTGAFLKQLSEFCTERESLAHLTSVQLQACLAFANKFCAFSVQHHGAIASYPTAEQMLVNTL